MDRVKDEKQVTYELQKKYGAKWAVLTAIA